MKHKHSVEELRMIVEKELLDAVEAGHLKKTGGEWDDPGLPSGVNPGTDLDDIPGESKSSGSGQKTPFNQVVEHALIRKWTPEKALETVQSAQVEGLARLIETVGRLEEKLNAVANRVEKITKK